MSSYNKTENLQLNQWKDTDIPKRTDFNYDNQTLDNVITEHHSNEEIHILQEEREKWNAFAYTGIYFGNGLIKRTIETHCPFDVLLGIVFADDFPPSIHYNDDGSTHHYVSLISPLVNLYGAKLDDNDRDFEVENSISADTRQEYSNLNQSGVMYRYVLFRDNRPL